MPRIIGRHRSARSLLRLGVIVIALALIATTFSAPRTASADGPEVQTVTFLGAWADSDHPVGSLDSTTEYTLDGGATWQPAYLVGAHEWGLVDGTNSWINCGPTMDDPCGVGGGTSTPHADNKIVTYRIRFLVPDGWSSPTMALQIRADNFGTVFLNGTEILPEFEGGRTTDFDFDVALDTTLQTGVNVMLVEVRDYGGIAGFNYRADISMIAPAPITLIPAGTPPADDDGDGVPNDIDAFPNSDLSDTVVVDGCDSGVANALFANGATMNDLIAEVVAGGNHGQIVSAVSAFTNDWKADGIISGRENGKITSCIARSDAGKKGR